ncbi:MAG: hypothetical protein KC416_02710 [Myxococcales bacterium]|nr:hypothetical protein [Myxococcales bacterium]
MILASVAVDPSNDRIVAFHGLSPGSNTILPGRYAMSLEGNFSWSRLPVPPDPLPPSVGGAYFVEHRNAVLYVGSFAIAETPGIVHISLVDGEGTTVVLDASGRTHPTGLSLPNVFLTDSFAFDGTLDIVAGSDPADGGNGWSFDPRARSFRKIVLEGRDALQDVPALASAPSPFPGEAPLFYGAPPGTSVGPETAWSLRRVPGSQRWTPLEPIDPMAPQPGPRRSATVSVGVGALPDSRELLVTGGEDADGVALDDTWFLRCLRPNLRCEWTRIGAADISDLSSNGVGHFSNTFGQPPQHLFFGKSAGEDTLGLWTMTAPLSAAREWEKPVVAATSPTGRELFGIARQPAQLDDDLKALSPERFFLVGGSTAEGLSNETWILENQHPAPPDVVRWKWIQITPDTENGHIAMPARVSPGVLWDEDEQRLFVYGGTDAFQSVRNDLWELRYRP